MASEREQSDGKGPYEGDHCSASTLFSDPNQGAICLDTLSTAWSPVLTIKSALISLQGLLASPEPKDPQDAEVASMLLKNKAEFEHVAQEWAIRYAGAPSKDKAESSGGTTAEDLLKRANEAKNKSEEQKPDSYVRPHSCVTLAADSAIADIMVTIPR